MANEEKKTKLINFCIFSKLETIGIIKVSLLQNTGLSSCMYISFHGEVRRTLKKAAGDEGVVHAYHQ